jgi:adenylate kinase
MIVVVTGTPGTGKTTLSKDIAAICNFRYVDVNKVVTKYKLSEGFDTKRDCKIIHEKKLVKVLTEIIHQANKNKENLVIDSHMSHELLPKLVDKCVITRCNLKTLFKRLKKKKYHDEKINENMQCEIMDVIVSDAHELGHNIIEVYTDKKISKKEIKKLVV